MSGPALAHADYQRLLAFRIELRRFLRHSEEVAQEAGLTPALHQLLLAVRGHPEPRGPMVGTLAEVLSVKHHTAVELAQRGEQMGLVRRTRDPDDHRQVHVRLTETGAERLEDLSRRHLPEIGQLARRLADVMADRESPPPAGGGGSA
jgi:DNA-binding MarR family transcriptional regulator